MNRVDQELALISKGAVLSFATSTYGGLDEPNKIIDGLRTTYWATGGMYPQIFIISFPKVFSISSIKMRSYLVKLISIEKSIAEIPEKFQFVSEKELQLTDSQHQVESLYEGKFLASHVKFTIKSGYDHISAVYKIEINGNESGSNEANLHMNQEQQRQQSPGSDNSDDHPTRDFVQRPQETSTLRPWEITSSTVVQQQPVEFISKSPLRSSQRPAAPQSEDLLSPLSHRDWSHLSPPASEREYPTPLTNNRPPSFSGSNVEHVSPRPPTVQRSLGAHGSSIKSHNQLEMFSESEEVLSDTEF